MKRLPRDQEKELADHARLVQRMAAMARRASSGRAQRSHGAIVAELMCCSIGLTSSSAPALLACFAAPDWSCRQLRRALDDPARAQSTAITRSTRAQRHAAALTIGVPHQPDNVFRRIKTF